MYRIDADIFGCYLVEFTSVIDSNLKLEFKAFAFRIDI